MAKVVSDPPTGVCWKISMVLRLTTKVSTQGSPPGAGMVTFMMGVTSVTGFAGGK